MGNYCIKAGYVAREKPEPFFDAESDITWQPDVYTEAARLARRVRVSRIVDLGCGNGKKIAALNNEFAVVGIDNNPANLALARELYPNVTSWWAEDLETDAPPFLAQHIVVAADVIEHMVHPEKLFPWVERAQGLVLSSPDRDLNWGKDHMGPPPNAAHVREWNRYELLQFVTQSLPEFDVEVALTRNNDRDNQLTTTLITAWRR